MPSKFQNLTSSCSCPACTPVWKGVRRNLVLVSFKIEEGQEEKKSRLVQRSWAGVLDVTCAGSVGGDKSGTPRVILSGSFFFSQMGALVERHFGSQEFCASLCGSPHRARLASPPGSSCASPHGSPCASLRTSPWAPSPCEPWAVIRVCLHTQSFGRLVCTLRVSLWTSSSRISRTLLFLCVHGSSLHLSPHMPSFYEIVAPSPCRPVHALTS